MIRSLAVLAVLMICCAVPALADEAVYGDAVVEAEGFSRPGNLSDGSRTAVASAGGPARVTVSREGGIAALYIEFDRIPQPWTLTDAASGGSLSCGREEAARSYAAEKRCIMVLKGANTVAAFPDGTTYVNHSGNPGLARGGSGDALTGIMGAMLCQFPPEKAVPLAVYLHGLAGDLAAGERGEYGMTITDVIEALPRAMKLITEE